MNVDNIIISKPMINLSPISINNTFINKQIQNQGFVSNPLPFKSTNNTKETSVSTPIKINLPQEIKRPATRETTLKKLDDFYDNFYKTSLFEISPEKINGCVEKISQKTSKSNKEILEKMQEITQFGNLNNTLKNIEKQLEKYEISSISNYTYAHPDSEKEIVLNNNFGLNSTLNYLIQAKKLAKLDSGTGQKAYFLDDNKLEQLEYIKENYKEDFENIINDKNNHFFILSGFNNGVNFLNSNEDLEEKTIQALKLSDIDAPTKERAKKLGIEPIIIKNIEEPSIKTIYEQLKPNQISKNDFLILLDANLIKTQPDKQKQVDIKTDLVQYLENTFQIYTPQRLTNSLKEVHSQIEEFAKSKGKTTEDIKYIIPAFGKSYDYINYQYQKVNNIDKDKFEYDYGEIITPQNKNKVLVILDDCTISGTSIKSILSGIYRERTCNNNDDTNIVIAPIYCDDFAKEGIDAVFEMNNRADKDKIITGAIKTNAWDNEITNQEDALISIGEPWFDGDNKDKFPCVLFPYMCPDNNSELASSIAILHSPIYQNNEAINYSRFNSSIKSYSVNMAKITNLIKELQEQENKP